MSVVGATSGFREPSLLLRRRPLASSIGFLQPPPRRLLTFARASRPPPTARLATHQPTACETAGATAPQSLGSPEGGFTKIKMSCVVRGLFATVDIWGDAMTAIAPKRGRVEFHRKPRANSGRRPERTGRNASCSYSEPFETWTRTAQPPKTWRRPPEAAHEERAGHGASAMQPLGKAGPRLRSEGRESA